MKIRNSIPGAVILPGMILFFVICACAGNRQEEETLRFDFGAGPPVPGFRKVEPADLYALPDSADLSRDFGFLEGYFLRSVDLPGREEMERVNPELRDCIHSDRSFIFLADVPEGNYDVKVTAAGIGDGSRLCVKAESRRLMTGVTEIPAGELRTFAFTTNVRYPEIKPGKRVRLKPRERGHFNWDRALSIEFSGWNPAIAYVEIIPNDRAITLFLAGNSTVTDQRHEPYSAWGQMLPVFFRPGLVSVANHAESGEALKSFVAEQRLEKLLSQVRPGDYFFIQFAHNDQKPESSSYSPPFTDYQTYLRRYIQEARNLGVNPVLVTPMLRRKFDGNGHLINTHGDYPLAMRQVAQQENVPLIDLFEMSRTLYESLGVEGSKKLFVHYPAGTYPGQEEELQDDSHHSTYGAYQLAKCVVSGIREQLPELSAYLVEDLEPYDPAIPDPYEKWDLPVSPTFDTTKPEGK